VDQFLTNAVPGFNGIAQNPNSTSTSGPSSDTSLDHLSMGFDHTSVMSYPTSFGAMEVDSMDAGGDGDQSFWGMINGGREEEIDFSAFVQDFNQDGSAT
jgi:hypothetical protein